MSHPVVERVLSGDVPPNVKLTAAQGLLPIPREDQVELWACLRNDPDQDVRSACRESLASVTNDEWRALLPETSWRPEFFDFAARVLARSPDLAEIILRNKSVPDETLVYMAGSARGQALDQILDLQNRLLSKPEIVSAMLQNAAVSASQARRLFDLAEQFFRDHQAIPRLLEEKFGLKIGHAGGEFKPAAAAQPAPKARPPMQPPAPQPAKAGAPAPPPAVPSEETPEEAAPTQAEGLLDEEIQGEEGGAEVEEKRRTLYEKLLTMTVPERISLAVRGDKEARTLLMRDSNKVVQEAVMDSPKMTDGEIEAVARMRNLPEELLRKVARNGEWMKRYGVVHGLVTNPKAPVGITMPLVGRLNDFDLKNLLKDKNVSDIIRREARKIYDLRHTPKTVNYKKGK